jgi:small conductance mechanosensitive channel
VGEEKLDMQDGETTIDGAEGAVEETPKIMQDAENVIGAFTDGDITQSDLLMAWNGIGWPITKAIILIIVVILIAGWVRRLVTSITKKAKVEVTLAKFFGNMAKWAIMLLGAIAILQTFGVDTTSFAAVVAALGFAIGLALSGTLGNFAAGIMLLIFRPYKVGDVVSVSGVTGKVDEIELFTTIFDTPDNRRIIVPNGAIFGSTIENITHHSTRRVDVAVGTDYGADLDKTREVLMGAATAVKGRLGTEDAVIYLVELGDSSISWAVRVWANTADYWAVREQLTRDIKVALDGAGIGIPFPQRDVHVPGTIEVKMAT